MIDFANFTPFSSFIGGLFIGIAVIIFFVSNGRLAGVSGIVNNSLTPKNILPVGFFEELNMPFSILVFEKKLVSLLARYNFRKSSKKTNYIYVLTPRGITEKTKLTVNFMKRKMKEYDELKKEIKKNNK